MSGPILVIDDEPYILRSLSYLLAREGTPSRQLQTVKKVFFACEVFGHRWYFWTS